MGTIHKKLIFRLSQKRVLQLQAAMSGPRQKSAGIFHKGGTRLANAVEVEG